MKIDDKTYIILGRHGKSIPNGDFDRGIEYDDRFVELSEIGHQQTNQFGITVSEAYPNMLFTITSSTHVRADQSAINIRDGIGTYTVHNGVSVVERSRALAIAYDSGITELNPGMDMTSDRKWIKDVYGMPNNNGRQAHNLFRKNGMLEQQDFWAEYYNGRGVFGTEEGFARKPIDGESLIETMLRAENFKLRLQKFAETQDFTYLGFSKEGAKHVAEEQAEIMPIIVSHKGFLNCFFKQAELTGYHVPTDKMMIPNAEPIMISIDENGKFAFEDMREQGFYLPNEKDKFSETVLAKEQSLIQA